MIVSPSSSDWLSSLTGINSFPDRVKPNRKPQANLKSKKKVECLESIRPAIEDFDCLILVVGLRNCSSRLMKKNRDWIGWERLGWRKLRSFFSHHQRPTSYTVTRRDKLKSDLIPHRERSFTPYFGSVQLLSRGGSRNFGSIQLGSSGKTTNWQVHKGKTAGWFQGKLYLWLCRQNSLLLVYPGQSAFLFVKIWFCLLKMFSTFEQFYKECRKLSVFSFSLWRILFNATYCVKIIGWEVCI